MVTEMDVLKMDERQRVCWLLANRAILMIIGVVWIGMIFWQLLHHSIPYFLIIMVPVFALGRLLLYLYYSRKTGKQGL